MSLCERFPTIDASAIIAQFVVPPRFASATFENYVPDESIPSQQEAKNRMSEFVSRIQVTSKKRFWQKPQRLKSIYLDGGFGVGKTHLLTALAHELGSTCAYGSFVEYTNLIGALGFEKSVEALAVFKVLCIDEFELDDPGDTVLMSTLLNRLVDRGVVFAVTSNTLPDRLGEGRFAADDFLREIQGLSAHFDVIRIDGPDYRHRHDTNSGQSLSDEKLHDVADRAGQKIDTFNDLNKHLEKVHPSAYGTMVEELEALFLSGIHQLTSQNDGLRWVALIDRLYDREIPVAYSGSDVEQLFSPEMLRSGYRKKYLRALSRLSALTREWWSIQDSNL